MPFLEGGDMGERGRSNHFNTDDDSYPQKPSEKRRVMEAAVMAERTRAKKMEQEEASMTADELRSALKAERRRMAKIVGDHAMLRASAVELQREAEVYEEGRVNGLMRRLDTLQQEKGRIIFELEREEEMVSRTDSLVFVCRDMTPHKGSAVSFSVVSSARHISPLAHEQFAKAAERCATRKGLAQETD